MSDVWMPSLHLKLSRPEFDQLPRHPSYQYAYDDGQAHVSPWPRYYHAQLDVRRLLTEVNLPAKIQVSSLGHMDYENLIDPFTSSFAHWQPFSALDETTRRLALEQSLQQTFSGGDGPWVESASFAAWEEGQAIGASLITLVPGGDPRDAASFRWKGSPPPDLWTRGEGQPHLTWIFVARAWQGHGIGTRLLQEAVRGLRERGYRTLWTTFMLGNDSSLLWHWRNGFELLPNAVSKRECSKNF